MVADKWIGSAVSAIQAQRKSRNEPRLQREDRQSDQSRAALHAEWCQPPLATITAPATVGLPRR